MTDATPTGDPTTGELTHKRIHIGSPELLFDCMTVPEHLTHFWGPTGTVTPLENIVVELRPGGRFETTLVNESDGGEYAMHAIYTEVDRPDRLGWKEVDEEGGMLTSITFTDLGDGRTEVVTYQTNVPAFVLTPEAQAGLQTSIDRMDAYLATLAEA
jgi:uncharacterized protein YndB with AHSA1/START domain